MHNELLNHVEQTVKIAYSFGEYLDLSEEELNILYLSAKYHDIGKIFIPEDILYKTEKLTKDEFNIIKRHPKYSYDILLASDTFNEEILNVVLEHHERVDGKGYPFGLTGDKISYTAKILSICDSYEAMTGNRCYKKSLTREEGIEEIYKGLGTQFDKDLGLAFINFLNIKKQKAS